MKDGNGNDAPDLHRPASPYIDWDSRCINIRWVSPGRLELAERSAHKTPGVTRISTADERPGLYIIGSERALEEVLCRSYTIEYVDKDKALRQMKSSELLKLRYLSTIFEMYSYACAKPET